MQEILVEVQELERLLRSRSVTVVDTRPETEFTAGHIPGSVNIPSLFTYLLSEEQGGFTGMLEFFREEMIRAGISNSSRLVIVEDAMNNGYGQSFRARLLFNYLGHHHVRVLHGGFRAWSARGKAVSKNTLLLPESAYEVLPDKRFFISKNELLSQLGPSLVLMDCRDQAEWVGAASSPYGIDFCPRKGRIPGAFWLEWYSLMRTVNGIPSLKTPAELRDIFQAYIPGLDQEVVLYCFKGARASFVLAAMLMAGYTNVKNYFGSWNEWSRDFFAPIDDTFKY